MKAIRGIWLSACAVGLGFLVESGCTERAQTSTEVENEIAARVVQGAAMDSVALDSAKWTAWDGTGAVVASGVTDTVGHFASSLSRIPSGGILVRVIGRGDTLWALSTLDTSVVRTRVATVLVHGLTSAAIPPQIKDPTRGFPDSLAVQAAKRGQRILDTVMGFRISWRDMASDPGFRAVAPIRGGSPSPIAGLIRAVTIRAAREDQSCPAWIVSVGSIANATVATDSLFAVDLAGSMAVLRLSQAQSTQFVKLLDNASGHPGVLENVWLSQQIIPNLDDLKARVPWAAIVANQPIWQQLVKVTGDQAAAYENDLSPAVKGLVQHGRTHEILAEVVGAFIRPDSFSHGAMASAALDTLLVRMVPQANLLLDQIKPEVWGHPQPTGTGVATVLDPVPQLLVLGLKSKFDSSYSWATLVKQQDPGSWLSAKYKPYTSGKDGNDSLRMELLAHPELVLPPNPFK